MLLFVNAFFDEELIQQRDSILAYRDSHPVYRQLEYLSCVIAEKGEIPLLLSPPDPEYCEMLHKAKILDSSPIVLSDSLSKGHRLISWGASELLSDLAQERAWIYDIPSFDVVKTVNGKDFPFSVLPMLPGGAILESEEELSLWAEKTKGPKVIKTLHGCSGRGHCLLFGKEERKTIRDFVRRERSGSFRFVAEPWVERILDFSSQWEISRSGEISYLGATICHNSPRGTYRGNTIGPEEVLFRDREEFWQEHLFAAERLLHSMAKQGFFGPVGLDAMLYRSCDSLDTKLHPVVEVNPRMTMGRVGVILYRKRKNDKLIRIGYSREKTEAHNLLPSFFYDENSRKIPLPGVLFLEEINN